MKYILNKSEFLKESNTEIDSICKQYGIANYEVVNGLVNVNGVVNLSNKGLTKLPLKFGVITGYFYCDNNELTSLDGCPKKVGGGFICSSNKLITLEGCPKLVGGFFNCSNNELTSLEGISYNIGGYIYCNDNPITKWWNQINDKELLEFFVEMDISSEHPDEYNEMCIRKIKEY